MSRSRSCSRSRSYSLSPPRRRSPPPASLYQMGPLFEERHFTALPADTQEALINEQRLCNLRNMAQLERERALHIREAHRLMALQFDSLRRDFQCAPRPPFNILPPTQQRMDNYMSATRLLQQSPPPRRQRSRSPPRRRKRSLSPREMPPRHLRIRSPPPVSRSKVRREKRARQKQRHEEEERKLSVEDEKLVIHTPMKHPASLPDVECDGGGIRTVTKVGHDDDVPCYDSD